MLRVLISEQTDLHMLCYFAGGVSVFRAVGAKKKLVIYIYIYTRTADYTRKQKSTMRGQIMRMHVFSRVKMTDRR